MDASTIKVLMSEVAGVVREFVTSATAPLIAENMALADRLAALEVREMPDTSAFLDAGGVAGIVKAEIAEALAGLPSPEKGEPGEVDMEVVAALIDGAVAEKVAALPPVEPIAPDMEAVRGIVDELTQQAVGEQLADAVKALPAPEKGEPGRDVDMEEVGQRIETAVRSAVEALPVPKDGESVDIAQVERMVAEKAGAAMAAIPPPKDGVGLADAFKGQDGHLILVMSDGRTKDMGRVDGETFTLDDFDIEPLDERTIKLKFTKGDVCHSFELKFPVPIYRGVYREGMECERGDMLTWGGSIYHCNENTADKPGTDHWTLANKKGRDGRDAKA